MKIDKLQTERLILRRFSEDDLQDLYEYLSNPEVVAYEPYEAMSMDNVRVCLKERIASKDYFAIEEKNSHKLIGNIYLGERYCESYEIGFVLNPAFGGKGYAFEAVSEVCMWLFRSGAHRLEANCDPLNSSSWKLLENGFLREGYLKKDIYFKKDEKGNPIWKDTYIYSKLNPIM